MGCDWEEEYKLVGGKKKIKQNSRGVRVCSVPFMLVEQLPVWASLRRLSPDSRLSSTSIRAVILMSVATLLPNTAMGVLTTVYSQPCAYHLSFPVSKHAVCLNQLVCLKPRCACPTVHMLGRLTSADANWLLAMAHWTIIALTACIVFLFPFGDECTGGEFHRGHQGWRA